VAKPFDKPIRESPADDPQQFLLYRMENEAIGARQYLSLTRNELTRYLKGLVKTYKAPPVKIVFEDLGVWAAEWREPNIIVFGAKRASRDILTAAHEFAHHLHGWIAEERVQENHGREFMACYMSVLDVSRMIPVVGMRAICKSYGIKFADPGTEPDGEKLAAIVRRNFRKEEA
jgi:hypothetical protein